MRRLASIVMVLGSVLVVPIPLFAQAAIAGVVRDSSGGVLPGVTVEAAGDLGDAGGGTWVVRVPVPPEAVANGVQTVVVAEAEGEVLGSFALVAGEALAPDLRAEIDLLRAELDMLKRAFRRHCLETAPGGGGA